MWTPRTDAVDTIMAADVNEAYAATLTNKSGGQRVANEVVVQDAGNDAAFATTTIMADSRVIGVVAATIANDAPGPVQDRGVCLVDVDAATERGAFLVTSATPGKATPVASLQQAVFARALTNTVGAGTVTARLVLGALPGPAPGFRQRVFGTLWGAIEAALTWTGAQIYQATVTFQAAVSLAATLAGTLLTVNQSGTGDVAEFQDGGSAVVRMPDGGGVVLVPQAGGTQSLAGLLYYDNTAAGFERLKLQHEGHNCPVPVDPRNGFRGITVNTTYP